MKTRSLFATLSNSPVRIEISLLTNIFYVRDRVVSVNRKNLNTVHHLPRLKNLSTPPVGPYIRSTGTYKVYRRTRDSLDRGATTAPRNKDFRGPVRETSGDPKKRLPEPELETFPGPENRPCGLSARRTVPSVRPYTSACGIVQYAYTSHS